MQKLRRLFALLAAFAAVFGFVACDNADDDANDYTGGGYADTPQDADGYISYGIEKLKSENYDQAVNSFNKAYELEQSDTTRVYSALATLASIATNSKIAAFAKEHFGIANYPTTLNALINGGWAEATEYVESTHTESLRGYKHFEKVESPEEGSLVFYRVDITPSSYLSNGVDVIVPISGIYSYLSDVGLYVTLEDMLAYNSDVNNDALAMSLRYKVTPSENGAYYIFAWWSSSNLELFDDAATYCPTSSLVETEYTYETRDRFPTLNMPEWFAKNSLNNQFGSLLLANILAGNVDGLNDAVDDLYAALFGTEYETACNRIGEIAGSVTLPASDIAAFGLDAVFGEDSVTFSKAELTLVKSALNLLKAALEYAQSLQLNTPLNYLKFDWASEDAALEQLKATLGKYNATIDPLANGFLGTRKADKLNAAKDDLLSVCEELIAAYDAIIAEDNKNYPPAVKDKLAEYKIYRAGAVALQTAIKDGDKFVIPQEEPTDETWPTYTANSDDIAIDFGALFTKDALKLNSLVLKASDGKPQFTLAVLRDSYDYNNGIADIHNDGSLTSVTEVGYWRDGEEESSGMLNIGTAVLNGNNKISELASLASGDAYFEDKIVVYLSIPVANFTPLVGADASLFNNWLYDSVDGDSENINVALPLSGGLWLYNFYYDGAIYKELTE